METYKDPHTLLGVSLKAKIKIKQYIEGKQLSPEIQILLLTDLEQERNTFYLFYTSLFCAGNSEVIDTINLAGYFYYKYLISVDSVADSGINKSNVILAHIVRSNFYHEESIRLLTTVFISYPQFWQYWEKRKMEYLNAYKIDRQSFAALTEEEFKILADSKSANGKTAIDSLYILNRINKQEYNLLLLSHQMFSCGFQYYDDVLDVREDCVNKQTNIALAELKKIIPPMEYEIYLQKPDELLKRLHISGIAAKLLEKAIICFDEAENIVQSVDCELWKQAISGKRKEVRSILKNIEFYVIYLKIKVRLSNEKLVIPPNKIPEIQDSISLAINFIRTEQELDGNWKDSPVNTWLSGYWTTGYVLHALQSFSSTLHANRAVEYLKSNKTCAWPYIEGWIEDADSSNFALLGLIANKQNVQNEIKELLSYQQNDGGFTTYKDKNKLLYYLDDPKIKDVSGWTQSHLCVSAGVLLVLSKFPDLYPVEKKRLIQFILKNKSEDNLWHSYWWTSPIYATSLIIEAAEDIQNTELTNLAHRAAYSLLSLQQENGFFADTFNAKHVFYSGLALQALCSSQKLFIQYRDQIGKIAQGLIQSQNVDGTWDSSFALRVPAANCINPSTIQEWKKSDLGQNIIIEDIHRVITTSTVINALSRYDQRANK